MGIKNPEPNSEFRMVHRLSNAQWVCITTYRQRLAGCPIQHRPIQQFDSMWFMVAAIIGLSQ